MSSLNRFIMQESDNQWSLNLLVEGMHCPSCVAIIEDAMRKQEGVTHARLNLSTRRLNLRWQGDAQMGDALVRAIEAMGYRAQPFDPKSLETSEVREEKFLLKCMAVAGFASGNLMLFSVPLWSSDLVEMGSATRTLFHFVQAFIAIPAIAYCGLPFYRSAWSALKEYRTNMDVPISVAVILATLMSLFETITGGEHSYFDSAVMLLFFLLIGRYLEMRARGRARSAAQDMLLMMKGTATILGESGRPESIEFGDLKEGMILLVAAGEKIGADGDIIEGSSEIDTSLISGESLPQPVRVGTSVFAGTINRTSPLKIKVTRAGERSLIADIVKLMETAEQSQARYVTLADRISRWYTPAVHALAAATFIGWMGFGDVEWQVALLYAATVLIITCPCALGLAVPVVQVIASGNLMRAGILLKSGSALERLARITHIVFDKTGTLTLGEPRLLNGHEIAPEVFRAAASMAAHSKHPFSKALSKSYSGSLLPLIVEEVQGYGLASGEMRLGKRAWVCEPDGTSEENPDQMELWFSAPNLAPVRFAFTDALKQDAAEVIHSLKSEGLRLSLLSGDRASITQATARQLGFEEAHGALSPLEKTSRIQALKTSGAEVLMVGDGLNDAPSLAFASVSMSPSSAIDIAQNAADIVFQGKRLSPVLTALHTARFAQRLVKENFWLAIGYNVIAIPLAVAGYVTPLIAAIAMSSSSILVILNAMRLHIRRNEQVAQEQTHPAPLTLSGVPA